MDEGIPHLQERQLLEHRDFIGLDYSSLYMCKPKRSMKRDDSKDTYKLPHRLIEKKRRDRINECIAQLKDLLPEHLKLTTLGHLEKAVVLELTLKHLKALTALTEQQHQKIIALQNGERALKSPIQSDLDAFHSGFQTCAKEVLQYLSRFESWTPREPRCVQLIGHLHAVAAQFLPAPPLLTQQVTLSKGTGAPAPAAPAGSAAAAGLERAGPKLEPLAHCVPVIQRTQPSAEPAAEHDTDTDSGYGGEAEARPDAGASRVAIKQEPPGEDSPAPKRLKLDPRGGGAGAGGGPGGGAAAAAALLGPDPVAAAALLRPDAALLSSLVAFGGGGGAPFAPPAAAAPLCLPFYFLSPSAAAAYVQPFLDKSGLEKYLYPAAAAPFPLLYPGLPAAAAAFPCLSSVLSPPPEKAAAAALRAHEGAPPGPRLPAHPAGRARLPFAGAREPGKPEGAAQEDPSPPGAQSP
ncbi:LOW QUALITY PROTEIN: class E basic helix-loop-helix protein 41 [Talpa occidentalis]|uniref:LOW QUALITY PROTEIN: class E basic helix-loop-helix protein 41 n=1 Tax=Talpa occidentalis TaxID=50954 RepID=UPI00188E36DA|nr:LOW QUALITY PROTEIN: class E basic helix-loop-helix protein 41 [Talpa occidentalis]